MSLYADICVQSYADERDIEFDETSKTWTLLPAWGIDQPIPGIPNEEMALAIARAIYAAYLEGGHQAQYS
jgi:hypothetical protein